MNEQEAFKQQLIEALGVTNQPADDQDVLIAKVELLANTRMATVLPELLTDEQYRHIEAMEAEGKKDNQILDWVENQIPSYTEMMRAMMLDIADEVTDGLK